MTSPKQLKDMDCIEALEALREDLQNLNLPTIKLYENFIDRAIQAHKDELKELNLEWADIYDFYREN